MMMCEHQKCKKRLKYIATTKKTKDANMCCKRIPSLRVGIFTCMKFKNVNTHICVCVGFFLFAMNMYTYMHTRVSARMSLYAYVRTYGRAPIQHARIQIALPIHFKLNISIYIYLCMSEFLHMHMFAYRSTRIYIYK